MGSARKRSWSHTRGELFEECPRAYFFQYYPWGEPEQDVLWFLRRLKTLEQFTGAIVHEMIALAIRMYVDTGHVARNLDVPAIHRYRAAVEQSAKIARVVRGGKRPPDRGDVLLPHLNGGFDESVVTDGEARVERALRAFESSDAWALVSRLGRKSFDQIVTDTDEKPYFLPNTTLGFKSGYGLRVYSVYDLVFRQRELLVIVDWKTGKKTESALAKARLQTATYSLWAMSRRVRREFVRVQPYFLDGEDRWDPQPVSDVDLDEVRRRVERHEAKEMSVVKIKRDLKSRISYHARREDFPPKPSAAVCGGCRFRPMCDQAVAP